MKILLINNQHYLMGGAHKVYFNTAEILRSKGHEVAFFSTLDHQNKGTLNSKFFVEKRKVKNVSFLQKIKNTHDYLYNREVKDKLTKLIKEFKPNVAHVHLFYGSLSVSVLKVLKDLKIPIVHTVHDYKLICPAKTFLNYRGSICEKCIHGNFYNSFFQKCSDSSYSQSFTIMLEAYFWKYFINPIHLIDKFIFVSEFIKNKHIEFNSEYNKKAIHLYNFTPSIIDVQPVLKKKYFLFFGRLSKEKGVETLLKAFIESKAELIIAGTGPLEDLVVKSALNYSNIKYVGFKNGDELRNLIENSLFVVVPSEWYENNPLTIIESFALGTPVIGADVGGIPELVIQNKTGFVFKMGKVNSLLDNIKIAQNLSSNEYHRISKNTINFSQENFNKEKHYDQLMNIYKNVINE